MVLRRLIPPALVTCLLTFSMTLSAPILHATRSIDAPETTLLEHSSTRPTALVLDAGGVPHLAYSSSGPPVSLQYQRGSEAPEVIAIVSTRQYADLSIDLALNGVGTPGVVWSDAETGKLMYAEREAGRWNVQTIDAAGTASSFPSLVFDPENRPHISFFDARTNDVRYAKRDAERWLVETVDASGEPGFHLSGGWTQIALVGSPARPVIAYQAYRYAPGDGALVYAAREEWGWQKETVDATAGVGGPLTLVLDDHGTPWISYYRVATWDYARGELRLAHQVNGNWQRTVLDRRGNAGRYNALTLIDGERPVVASYDAARGDLHIFWQSPTWQTALLVGDGDVGAWVQLAASGRLLHLTFVDGDAQKTRYGTMALPEHN